MTTPDQSKHSAVIEYYDATWKDYAEYWLDERNLAMHFGFSDQTTKTHAQALTRMNEVMADRAGIGPNDRMLDAGCGVGGSCFWVAEHRGAEVVGITIVETQLASARQHAEARNLTNQVSFALADYHATGFSAQSFDVVWALESHCHSLDKPLFYREMMRVLRPGGRLVLCDGIRSSRPLSLLSERLFRRWANGWAVPDVDTLSEHGRNAIEAGFIDIEVKDITHHVIFSAARLFGLTIAVGLPRAMIRRIYGGQPAAIRLRNSISGALGSWLALTGKLRYGFVFARKPGKPSRAG